jgi:hypothetical protein
MPARLQLLAHVSPGGGYSADVVGERHYAYLSSHKGRSDCPAQGVRVYDLSNPRRPRMVATFADGRSVPALKDAWTEKTIVRHVHTSAFTGVLAVTSVQACPAGLFGGFALYDVTRPAHPRRLALVRTEPRGSHEIWLAAARGHAWVYTALASTEFAFSSQQYGFHIFDVSNPRKPHEVGGWSACRDLHLCTPVTGGTDQPKYLVHSVITNAAAAPSSPTGISARSSSTSATPRTRATSAGRASSRARRGTRTRPGSRTAGGSSSRRTRSGTADRCSTTSRTPGRRSSSPSFA